MRYTTYKGTNEELRGEDNTKGTLRTNLNKPTYGYIDVKLTTLISYDNANVRRNVKEIQLTTSELRICRGYHTVAQRYEFYFRVVKTIFYERAQRVS